ncbi:insulysin [Pancytospora philotis]|nr:insulysin [Pancytospora philotis]
MASELLSAPSEDPAVIPCPLGVLKAQLLQGEAVVKGAADANEYRTIVLSNGIAVMLVRNPRFTKACVALSVGVGSYDDPADFPGLAHFLEHMLFMGTEKYPGENEFQDFLNRHNGSTNAYTADDFTVYYADIDAAQLREMADMFASFFTCPLFIEDSVTREISAVNSEFLNSMNEPYWRQHAVLSEFVRAGDQRGRFSMGNTETLSHDSVWERVKQFWQDTYAAGLMKVVVCGDGDFDQLAGVAQIFEGIESKPKLDGAAAERAFCNFEPQSLGKIVKMEPLDDAKEVTIVVNLPPLHSRWRESPLELIRNLLTLEEDVGLPAQLKNAGLAFGLDMAFEQHFDATKVLISVQLSNAGCADCRSVLDMVRQYIATAMLEEPEYERLRRIYAEDFDMRQQGDPIDFAPELAERMQLFPAAQVLRQPYTFDAFDGALVTELLEMLGDTRRWLVVLADNRGDFTHEERFYGVRYCHHGEYLVQSEALPRVNSGQAEKWATDRFVDSFSPLPTPGRFVLSGSRGSGAVGLVFDGKLGVPQAVIYVLLEAPESAAAAVEVDLYLRLTVDSFVERHARKLANLHVTVGASLGPNGAQVKFSGVRTHLAELCCLFCSELGSSDMRRLQLFKKQLADEYNYAIMQAPWDRLRSTFTTARLGLPSYEETLEALSAMQEGALPSPKTARLRVLAVGNIEFSDVERVYDAVEAAIALGQPLETSAEEGRSSSAFETKDQNNNGVALYYEIANMRGYSPDGQSGAPVLRSLAIGHLWLQICRDEFFNQLRTLEELGYCVSSSVVAVRKQHFLGFFVQSEKSVEFLEERIVRFVEDMREELEEMDDETFEEHRSSVISSFREPILNLPDLSSTVMWQSRHLQIDLEHGEKMAAVVSQLTREDLLGSSIFEHYSKVCSSRGTSDDTNIAQ